MPAQDLARHPEYTNLHLGDYHRDSDYRMRRPAGSRNWLLFVTAAGAGRFIQPQGRLTARPGRLVLLDPGTPHDYGTDPEAGTWTFAWAHVKAPTDWRPLLAWPEVLPGVHFLTLADPAVSARVLDLLRDGVRVQDDPDDPIGPDLARLRLHEALLIISRADPRREEEGRDPRIRRICSHLARHLAEPHTLATLARRADLSPGRFAHLFACTLGQPPMAYLEQLRLQTAAHLLQDPERPIAAIAISVGFANARHFATRFRRWAGASPRDWRQRRHTATEGRPEDRQGEPPKQA